MALGAFILEPLAQAADGDACSLSHAGVHILESCVDDRPDAIHERDHELGAALDGDAECEHTAAAKVRIRRGGVVLEILTEWVEDLRGRQVRGQSIDDAHLSRLHKRSVGALGSGIEDTNARRYILIYILSLSLSGYGHKTLDDRASKVGALNLRFLTTVV